MVSREAATFTILYTKLFTETFIRHPLISHITLISFSCAVMCPATSSRFLIRFYISTKREKERKRAGDQDERPLLLKSCRVRRGALERRLRPGFPGGAWQRKRAAKNGASRSAIYSACTHNEPFFTHLHTCTLHACSGKMTPIPALASSTTPLSIHLSPTLALALALALTITLTLSLTRCSTYRLPSTTTVTRPNHNPNPDPNQVLDLPTDEHDYSDTPFAALGGDSLAATRALG